MGILWCIGRLIDRIHYIVSAYKYNYVFDEEIKVPLDTEFQREGRAQIEKMH